MAGERTIGTEAIEPAPRRAVWAAPFVLLVAIGVGLATAYPTLRPGTDVETEGVGDAALSALVQPLRAVTERAFEDSVDAGAVPTDHPDEVANLLPAARVVTGNARSLPAEDAIPGASAHGTRFDVPADDTVDVPAAVVVVRGRTEAPEPADDGGSEAAAAPVTLTVAGVSFGLCRETPYIDCVVDGDTFYHRGDPVRIADIDAPEIRTPACLHEAELGARATYRLLALLNAGRFVLAPPEEPLGSPFTDDYGRALRLVLRDGRSLGGTLVGEGLARAWDGPAARWCG